MITRDRLAAWYRALPWWLLLPGLIAVMAMMLLLAVRLLPYIGSAGGTVLVLLGAAMFVAGLALRLALEGADEHAALVRDPERAFAWSEVAAGAVLTWQLKHYKSTAALLRGVRATVGLYTFLTCVLLVAYGVGFVMLLRGGPRRGDLVTFVPVSLVAFGILAFIVRIAWRALRDVVPFEVSVDRAARLLIVRGVRPRAGAVTLQIPFADITQVRARRTTYRYMTSIRVHVDQRSGPPEVMFSMLGVPDWERISGSLALVGVPMRG
jgi:uncharacterized membrane protein